MVAGRQLILCDYPVENRRSRFPTYKESSTCDKPLCRECAISVGPDKDHCPSHKTAPAQGELNVEVDDFQEKLEKEVRMRIEGAGLEFEKLSISRSPRGGHLVEIQVCKLNKHRIGHFVAKDKTPASARAVASAAASYFPMFLNQP